MNLLKNYFYFFKLSLVSLILSILVLNIALYFYDTKKALLITLIIIFFINFIKLKNHYKFDNNYIFFIYSIFTRFISRTAEYYLFLFIFNILDEHNISWVITISFTHFLKFFFVEIYKKISIKNKKSS
mgnify:CR=1 FL=1